MTREEHEKNLGDQYPMALAVKEMTRDDDKYRSYLVAHESVSESSPGSITVQGDIRPLFDVGDDYASDEQGRHGHYIVEALLAARLDMEILRSMTFESESATFFAYCETEDEAINFMEAVFHLGLQEIADESEVR